MSGRGPEPRWLCARDTANYISVRVGDLPRLVKEGRIPEPAGAEELASDLAS